MKCKGCLNDFESCNKQQLYCCQRCQLRYKSKRHYSKYGHEKRRIYPKKCEFCHKDFKGSKKSAKFCSRLCASNYRKIYLDIPQCLKESHRRIDRKLGYVRVYCPHHPMANTWGYVYEHRLIIEQAIGRLLNKDEHVHHKDGVRHNNSLDNLEILSPSEHAKKLPPRKGSSQPI